MPLPLTCGLEACLRGEGLHLAQHARHHLAEALQGEFVEGEVEALPAGADRGVAVDKLVPGGRVQREARGARSIVQLALHGSAFESLPAAGSANGMQGSRARQCVPCCKASVEQ